MASTPVRCGSGTLEGELSVNRSSGVYRELGTYSNSHTRPGSSSNSTSRRPKPSSAQQQTLQRSTDRSTSSSTHFNRSNSSSQCNKGNSASNNSTNSNSTENIKVVVRCRPINAAEQRSGSSSAVHIAAETQQVSVLLPAAGSHRQQQQQQRSSRVYRFDGVCPVSVQQGELFDTHVKPIIDQVLEGYNCTLFAYGQTGTGKTYTIEGPHDQYLEYLHPRSTSGTTTTSSKTSSSTGLHTPPVAAPDASSSTNPSNGNTPSDSPTSSSSGSSSSSSISSIQLHPDAGILPRAVSYIFQQLQQSSNNRSSDYMLRCSFLEIYNEELVDLLAPPVATGTAPTAANSQQQLPQQRLKIYEDQHADNSGTISSTSSSSSSSWGATKGHGAVRVEGLTEKRVSSPQEVFALLLGAAPRRSFACSGSNARSSRSHTIFSLSVCITESPKLPAVPSDDGGEDSSSLAAQQQQHASGAFAVEEVLRIGKLNLVDLAGSENLEKSWGRGADSARRKEASAINQSLLTLGRCINALVEKNAYIPFRDSKLTRLLQDSLGGTTKTCLIATIGPTADTLEETLCTLDYAFRAKSVTTRPVATLRRSRDALLSQLMTENAQLRLLLQLQREREGVFLPLDMYKEQQQQQHQQQQMLQQQGVMVQQLQQQLDEQRQAIKEQQEKEKKHLLEIEALQVSLQLSRKNLSDEQLLTASLQQQQQHHATAAAAVADSLQRAVADIHLLQQQQQQQKLQQQAAADACTSFAASLEAATATETAEQLQLLEKVQQLLRQLQETEQQRAGAASEAASAAAGHHQQHKQLQEQLQKQCELLLELHEKQKQHRQLVEQQLQRLLQEVEMCEATGKEQQNRYTALLQELLETAQRRHQDSIRAAEQEIYASGQESNEKQRELQQAVESVASSVATGGDAAAQQLQQLQQQLQTDAQARQEQTEAAAAAVVAAVQQQLAAFVEAQRTAAQQQQLQMQQHLASVQRQQQQQQTAHTAAAATASSAATAAAAAADALSEKSTSAAQHVFDAAAAVATEWHRRLTAAKEEEAAETHQRLTGLRTSCQDATYLQQGVPLYVDVGMVQHRTTPVQQGLLQHVQVLLNQQRQAEETARAATADSEAAAAQQAQQQQEFSTAATAAIEAAAAAASSTSRCCEKQAAAAVARAGAFVADAKDSLRSCRGISSGIEATEGDTSNTTISTSSDGNREGTSSSCCSACAATAAAHHWEDWKPHELPPLLSISTLREANSSKAGHVENHPPLTPEESPTRVAVAAAANQSNSCRKTAGTRLIAAGAAVTAAATPQQTQRLGRIKSLGSAHGAPSPQKGAFEGSSKQQQQRQAVALATTDGRIRRRSRSSDERSSADSANKKRHTPTDESTKHNTHELYK